MILTQTLRGSSPRVWGQAVPQSPLCDADGIIPTRVGTSACRLGMSVKRWDHPHACGDKARLCNTLTCFPASSPRVWGQAALNNGVCWWEGIIPTRVGTRHTFHFSPFIIKDHPHACGDKEILEMSTPPSRGSSPRVWGQGLCCGSVC